jgi:hypothetical protein
VPKRAPKVKPDRLFKFEVTQVLSRRFRVDEATEITVPGKDAADARRRDFTRDEIEQAAIVHEADYER